MLPLRQLVAKRAGEQADQKDHGGDFWRRAHEGGDRGGGAFVDVRGPHVERDGRDFEAQAGDDEDNPDGEAGRGEFGVGHGFGDVVEGHAAGEAVDQGDPVQQQARGQGTENEVFQASLGGTALIAGEGGQHIDRQAHQFEAEIQRHQAAGRDHQHHADGGEQHQDGDLEAAQVGVFVVVEREHHAEADRGQDQQLGEAAIGVDGEQAVIAVAGDAGDDQHRGQQQGADHHHRGGEEGLFAAGDDAVEQDGHAGAGQHDFGQC